MKKYLTFTGPMAVAVLIFLYLPTYTILINSVNSVNSANNPGFWKGFSTKWYAKAFSDPILLAALKNTFILAGISAAIATVIGTMLGYGLNRYRFPGKRLFNGFLHVPVFVPDIVTAVSMLLFYAIVKQRLGILDKGMLTMVLAHVTVQVPIVAIIVRARLEVWASSFEEAAADLGASPTKRFRQITIPLIRPGIIAGGLLAFTISLGDFVVSYFTAGPTSRTVPIVVYSRIKDGASGDVLALASIVIIVGMICAIAVALIQRSRKYETI
jgi:spermidine/putrescine transport system permease protein